MPCCCRRSPARFSAISIVSRGEKGSSWRGPQSPGGCGYVLEWTLISRIRPSSQRVQISPQMARKPEALGQRLEHCTVDEYCTSTPHAQHEGAQHGNAQQGHAQHRVHTARARAAGTRNASALLWATVTSVRGTTCVSHPSQDAAAARRAPPSAHAADRQAHFCGAGLPARMPTRPLAAVGRRGPPSGLLTSQDLRPTCEAERDWCLLVLVQ